MMEEEKKERSLFSGSRVRNERKNRYKKKEFCLYPERRGEVENFLSYINSVVEEIEENNVQIREILINSEEFYGKQIEEINEYFETILHSLELEKNKCYNHILLERKNAERAVRELMGKLADGET
jgi:lipid A disaccharide synthetase